METEKRNIIYKSIMLVLITAMITFMGTSIALYNYFTKTEQGTEQILTAVIQKEQTTTLTDSGTIQKRLSLIKAYLEQKYIGELDEEKMFQGAIKGYVSGIGDEYTEYLTKSEYEELMITVTGDFVGIGIYMTKDTQGNVVVLLPIEGSPAEEVGLQTGDIILTVDGEDCQGIDLDLVSSKIKGEEGTKVKLEILREGNVIEKEVERRKVVIKDSSAETLEDNIGYIRLITFDEESAANVKQYIEDFQKQGINKIILDLRDNTGGIVTEAIELCELFVEKDKIIMKSYDKVSAEEIIKSSSKETKDVELVLLVNEMSASASEIVTGALKDNDVATIIGTTTYGKGVMQEIVPIFGGEAALKLTIEEFFTPNGDKINKVGIEPDITIEDNQETEEDEQLERAIQFFNEN